MKWPIILFYWITASLAVATVPIDLQSPFLKTVIYQKNIGGYGAGPEERKEVVQGEKKNGLYEFRKADGTLLLISESEVLGVLPVFPSLETPCEKGDVEAAIRLLEKAKGIFPGQPEVAEPVLEKWKSLALAFGKIEKEWLVPSGALHPSAQNLFLGWALGLPVGVLLILVVGLFGLRKRTGFALVLILIGLGGGVLFWASLQLPAQAQPPQNLSHEDDCRRIFWAVSCAKKTGLVHERTLFRVPADDWLNFLFQRIRFSERSVNPFVPTLSKPFFQKQEGGILVQQPIQVGPLMLPLTLEYSPLEGKNSPEQLVVNKVWMGRVPWPSLFAEQWVGSLFQGYWSLWDEILDAETVKWKVGSGAELEIEITPPTT